MDVESESIYRDILYGNAGDDTLYGGGGDDTLYGDNRDPNDAAATGNDVLVGGIGKDVLYGGAGEDELYGDRRDINDIADSHGDDFLVGGKGEDKLYGGAGNDKLAGGADDDRLVGGFGVDTYIINTGDGKDTIVDTDRSVLVRNGQRFVGFFEKQGDSYVLVTDARVRIEIRSPAKLDFGDNDAVTFENLTSEELVNQNLAWVHLEDYSATPDATRTIVGDLEPTGASDDLGNPITTGGADAPDRPDTLLGSAGNDLIQSRGGNDVVFAKAGDDTIEGGGGRDSLDGGTGKDILSGGADADVLYGGGGNDQLFADARIGAATAITQITTGAGGRELLIGGDGDDMLIGAGTADALMGGSHDDLLIGGAGDDDLLGDVDGVAVRFDGKPSIDWTVTRSVVETGNVTSYSLTYSNTLTAAEAAVAGMDTLYGGAGSDWLIAGGADDYLDGGADNDVLYGEAGNDALAGGDGDDVLAGDNPGQGGDDWLSGGAGVDQLFGGGGIDVLEGGAGQDFLAGGTGDDSYDFALGDGQDSLQDDDGFDIALLPVNLSDLRVELVEGAPGYLGIAYGNQGDTLAIKDGLKGAIDFFTLNDGSYTLGEVLKKLKTKVTVVGTNPTGNSLYGGANDDTLSAAAGTNVFQAGDGINTISGGTGKDTYVFSRASASDTIRDAGGGEDNVQMIDLAPEEFEIYRDARSFQLVASATLDFITLVDGYVDPTARVETIAFDDGTVWDYNYLVAHAVVVPSLGGVIIGTPQDDVLTGSAGADWIYGLESNDTITGLAGNDTVDAGAGNDVIDGGGGDDIITGGAGNDTLEGGSGDDRLDGGAGGDTYIVQGTGNKTITENDADGNDLDTLRLPQLAPTQVAATSHTAGDVITLRFGSSPTNGTITLPNTNDINSTNNIERIVFSDGTVWDHATLLAHTVTDPVVDRYFQSVAGSAATPYQTALEQHVFTEVVGDLFYGDNNLAGSDARDTLYGAYGDDVLNGGLNADRIYGGGGNDTVDGGSGDDRVEGGNGADRLAGGVGDDIAVGGFGNDVLNGGAGTDVLYGGDGDDSYLFGIGDGFDTILDSTDTASYTRVVNLYSDVQEFVTGAPNRVVFGAGITLELLSAGQAGVFVTPGGITLLQSSFNVGEGDDSIMLVTARGNGPAVQNFEFADGSRYTFDQLITLTTRPGVLNGGGGADILAGSSGDDRINGRGGNDYLIGAGGNDTLVGGRGDDYLEGGSGNDTLDGSFGSDRLEGGVGNDVYVFGRGYGVDTISEDGAAAGGANTVRLAGDVLAGDVTLSRDVSDNLLITINGSADQLKVQGYFTRLTVAGHSAAPNPKIDQIVFGDGAILTAAEIDAQLGGAGAGDDFVEGTPGNDVLNGLAGNDVLEGNAGDDTLDGGSGKDILRGSAGNDSYLFGRGAGQDIIEENDTTAGNLDTLQLAGDVLPGDVTLRRDFRVIDFTSNLVVDDLVLTINGSADQLTVRDYFAADGAKIERIVFGDGTVLPSSVLDALSNPATSESDVLVGTAGNDMIDGLAGDDTIYGRNGDDTLIGGEGFDALSGEEGNDTLAGGAGIDALHGGAGDDLLDGGEDVDALFGGAGADLLKGGAGNDFLHGEADADFLSGGPGDDRLSGGDGGDALLGDAGDDTLNGDAGDDLLVGGEGVDSLNGGEGNDTLSGGPGNDSLSGGDGDDRYVFVRGAGADTIVENDPAAGKIDTVVFGALKPHEIVVTKGAADSLVLTIADSGEQLTIQGYFASDAQKIDRAEFEDGTVWDAAYIAGLFVTVVPGATEFGDFISGGDTDEVIDGLGGNDVINGLGGNDLLLGGAGKDILDGGVGNDILDGGAGDDRLRGGAGSDTYRFARGGGRDLVLQSDNTAGRVDRLLLGPAIAPVDLTLTRGGEDGRTLFINLNGGTDRIELSGWYVSAANRVDQLVFDNGVVWDTTTIESHQIVSIVADGGQNSIFGTQGDDILTGLAGSNQIFGFGGNDTLQGRQFSDSFYGGAGSDTYLFGRGDGDDAIEETSAPGDANIVRLGATVAPADVIVSRDYQNLYLKIAGTNDRLTLSEWFVGDAFNVQQVVFHNGTIWNVPTLRALANTPTAGNDFLTGSAGNDLINALAGNDTVDGRGGNDTLLGGAGSDTLSAPSGNNTFDGGADDDYLLGGTDADTYLFGHGSGHDTVYDSGLNYTIQMAADVSPDQVTLSVVGDDLTIALNDSGETITVPGWVSTLDISAPYVRFEDGMVWNSAELQSRTGGAPLLAFGRPMEGEISFFGGNDFNDPSIHGGAGLKEIFGGSGDDTFDALASGNVLYGGLGSDTYRIETGAGRLVTIVETPSVVAGVPANDINRIVFGAGITPENLTIVSGALNHFRALDDYAAGGIYDAADLVLGFDNFGLDGAGFHNGTPWGGSRLPSDDRFSVETGNLHSDVTSIQYGADEDRILIKDGTLGRIQSYQFADGTVWNHAQLMANLAQQTDGSEGDNAVGGGLGTDIIFGNGGDDAIAGLASGDYLYGGAGNDALDGGDGVDRLDGGSGNDTLHGGADGDYLFGQSGGDQIYGDAGNDFIEGGAGNDAIDGGGAADHLDGGDGGDLVFGGAGDDFIQGDTYHTAITILGTTAFGTVAGNDELHGDAGDDAVYGLDGDDLLYGDDGADYLDGGNGDDALYGGTGDDILRGDLLANVTTGGNDWLDGGAGADDLRAGAGNDSYVVDNTGDVVVELAFYANASGFFTVEGGVDLVLSSISYTLTANVENMTLTGVAAIDGTGNALGNFIVGNAAANVLTGLGGNDSYVVDNPGDFVNEAADGGVDSVESSISYTLSDNVENLTLTGTAAIDGNGNALDNTFRVNRANNIFLGGDGADTYHFGRGAGQDTVVDAATIAGANDTVQVAAGVAPDQIRVYSNGSDLQLAIKFTSDRLILKDWLRGPEFQVEFVNFEDGTSWGVADLVNLAGPVPVNTAPLLALPLTDQSATENQPFSYRLAPGSFADVDAGDALLYAATQAYGLPLPEWLNFNSTTNTLTGTPGAADAGTYSIRITATDTAGAFVSDDFDLSVDSLAAEVLVGTAGSDHLRGGAGDDVLRGGAGDDLLSGGSGNDTYAFAIGDGEDRIVDGAGINAISFGEGVTTDSLSLDLGSLLIHYGAAGDAIHIDLFNPQDVFAQPSIADFHFADGSVLGFSRLLERGFELHGTASGEMISGTNIYDRIYAHGGDDVVDAGAGDDLLDGGAGNDLLIGGAGNDRYVFSAGGGADRIDGSGAALTDIDSVELGVPASDVVVTRAGGDLVISLAGTGDSLIIEDFDGAQNRIETVQFSDGASWTRAQLVAAVVRPNHAPTLAIDLADQSALEDAAFSFTLPAGEFADTDGGDLLTLGVTRVDGSALPSWLSFDATTRTFSGTPLNADVGTIGLTVTATDESGAAVSDTFNLSVVNTNDMPVAVNDSFVVFENAGTANLALALLGNDSDPDSGDMSRIVGLGTVGTRGVVTFNPSAQTLTYAASGAVLEALGAGAIVIDTFSYTIADVAGAVATATVGVTVTGLNDAPMLTLQTASQTAIAGSLFALTLAANTFSDVDAGDTLSYSARLAGGAALPSWLSFNPATRTLSGTAGQADAGTYAINVIGADSGNLMAVDAFTLTVTAAVTGQMLAGTAANDVLTGGAGNDTLDGRGGADRLIGNDGDDALIFFADYVWIGTTIARNVGSPGNPGNAKTAQIGGKNRSFDIFEGGAGNDVLVGTSGADGIVLEENFSQPHGGLRPRIAGIERIEGGAGNDVISLVGNLYAYGNVTLDGGDGIDVLWASSGDDVLLGGAGNDDLFGGAGYDYLNGGAGVDTLDGDRGNDLIEAGSGNDNLTDGYGNNLFYANDGNDMLGGGDGNELFIGGTGNDGIVTGAGADVISFNRGDGRDTVAKSSAHDNTISLGGGIRYSDLYLLKQGNNLVLETAGNESLTLTDWFAGSGNRSVANLQLILEGGADYLPGGVDVLRDNKIESFDFNAIVRRFEQALLAVPGQNNHWAVMNALLDAHLDNGSDTEALGGNLAYRYGMNGTLAGISINSAHAVLANAQFGVGAQVIQPLAGLEDGLVRLS